jgi:hypothetical protein
MYLEFQSTLYPWFMGIKLKGEISDGRMIVSSEGPWSQLLRVEQQVLDDEARARDEASAFLSRAQSDAQNRRRVRLDAEAAEGRTRLAEASHRHRDAQDRALASYSAQLDLLPTDPSRLRDLVRRWLQEGSQ